MEITGDLAAGREHDDAGSMRELLVFGVIGVTKTDGFRQALDGLLFPREEMPAARRPGPRPQGFLKLFRE